MQIVEETLTRFREGLRRRFADSLADVIIHGSYVLGDFRPHRGDLDFVLVFHSDVTDAQMRDLFVLVGDYRDNPRLLLAQLEGTAYPWWVLAMPHSTFRGCSIGTGRAGWKRVSTFQNSMIELRVMRAKGRSLFGHAIDVYDPCEAEILDEQKSSLAGWRKALACSGGTGIGLCYAVIQWCARTIVYRRSGRLSSKAGACNACASGMAPEGFAPLFVAAEDERYPYRRAAQDATLATGATGLLDYVAEMLEGEPPPL